MLTKVKKVYPQKTVLNSPVYNRSFVKPLDKTIDELVMSYLLIDIHITPTLLTLNTQDLAWKLFSDIVLETTQKKQYQHIKPQYSKYRLNIAHPTLYDAINTGITCPSVFVNGTCQIKVPLFLFFSDKPNGFLNVRNGPDLQLRFITNSQSEASIIDSDFIALTINKLEIDLVCESYNNHYFVMPSTIPIRDSYDVYYEKEQALLSGSSRYSFLLTADIKCYNIIMMILGAGFTQSINSFSLVQKGTEVLNIPTELNYNINTLDIPLDSKKIVLHHFNQNNESGKYDQQFDSRSSNYPSYLTINYSELTSDATFYVFYQYKTDLNKKI